MAERRRGELHGGDQRQRRELLALRLLNGLGLALGELAQRAEELLGIAAAEREEASASALHARRLVERQPVAGLDLSLELRDRRFRGCIAVANGDAAVGSSSRSSRLVAAPISSSLAGVAS